MKDIKCPSQPKTFENQEAQVLFDVNTCQTQKQLGKKIVLQVEKIVLHQLNVSTMKSNTAIIKILFLLHETLLNVRMVW